VRWKWGLLSCIGAACLAAAGASAAARADLFVLTLAGTASEQWDHTGAPTPENECSKTERTEGLGSIRFRSRPTRVRIADGRLIGVDLRGLRGTVTLGGAETTETTCPGGGGSAEIRDCVTSVRRFAGAAVRLSSPARGRLAFGAVRGVRLARVDCPDEIAAVLRAPAGPSPNPIRLPLDKLTNPRSRSVVIRVSGRREVPIAAPEAGSVKQGAAWTLTFTRVAP
jgi:hypothetical protein